MFKATLDGNGLVIYSTSAGGEILADMPLVSDPSEAPALNLEPSIILKGAFASKFWFDGLGFNETYALQDYKPFYGIITAPMGGAGSGSGLMQYLLSRHPNLKLISVEVEYKELIGSTIPVALAMWTYVAGDWSSSFTPFYVKEVANRPEWQVAKLDLLAGHIEDFSGVCPFRNFTQSEITPTGSPFEGRWEIAGCFTHVAMWSGSPLCHELVQLGMPVFHLCGGVGAVRRISFNFAGSQFWTGFTNAAELIHLYDRPEPPAPVDPEEPGEPGEPDYIVKFSGGSWRYKTPADYWINYPTPEEYNEDYLMPPLSVDGGDVPWTVPYLVVEAGLGPGGVAIQYEDGNNVKWHIGSNGGLFRFFNDGRWRFDGAQAFWDLEIDAVRESYVDFVVQDEFGLHNCRAVAEITGMAPPVAPDQYTLRPVYVALKSVDYDEWDPITPNVTGNVFANAEDPDGWVVTEVKGQTYYVGASVPTLNAAFDSYVSIAENGDFEVRVGSNVLNNATPPQYPWGYVFISYVYYKAEKNGVSKTETVYVHVSTVEPPSFVDNIVLAKVSSIGQVSGQIDVSSSNLTGTTSATCIGTYYWCSEFAEECDPTTFVGTTGYPIFTGYGEEEPYPELFRGLFSITSTGAWSFDTNGDFDYMGPTEVFPIEMYINFTGDDGGIMLFRLRLQIGDVTQDVDWEEGP